MTTLMTLKTSYKEKKGLVTRIHAYGWTFWFRLWTKALPPLSLHCITQKQAMFYFSTNGKCYKTCYLLNYLLSKGNKRYKFFWFFFYHFVYGCMFCILLFNSVSYVFLLLCLCILIDKYALFCILFANWHSPATLAFSSYPDWGFSVLFPQLYGKCQGIPRKDGARSASS